MRSHAHSRFGTFGARQACPVRYVPADIVAARGHSLDLSLMAQRLRLIALLALTVLCCAPALVAVGASKSGGWAKLAARPGPHGAIRHSFAASAAGPLAYTAIAAGGARAAHTRGRRMEPRKLRETRSHRVHARHPPATNRDPVSAPRSRNGPQPALYQAHRDGGQRPASDALGGAPSRLRYGDLSRR
jgi:hypothetical protein